MTLQVLRVQVNNNNNNRKIAKAMIISMYTKEHHMWVLKLKT